MHSNVLSKKPLLTILTGAFLAGTLFAQEAIKNRGPAKVEVRQTDGRWQLYVDQKPFFIKGAGLELGDQKKLAAAGGNSFRTWRTENGRRILDRAAKNGLCVTMGLEVRLERHG